MLRDLDVMSASNVLDAWPGAAEWSVYLLANLSVPLDRRDVPGSRFLYVGITTDVARRLKEHNTGYNTSTKGGNWVLLAQWGVFPAGVARVIEKHLKTGNTRLKRLSFWRSFSPDATAGRPAILFAWEVVATHPKLLSYFPVELWDYRNYDNQFGHKEW